MTSGKGVDVEQLTVKFMEFQLKIADELSEIRQSLIRLESVTMSNSNIDKLIEKRIGACRKISKTTHELTRPKGRAALVTAAVGLAGSLGAFLNHLVSG